MNWKFLLLLAIIIGGLLGSEIKDLPGFVLIAYEQKSYEMRLWVAVCFLLLAFIALTLLILLIVAIFSGRDKLRQWTGGRSFRQARNKTINGMLAYTEGRWKDCENLMVNAAKRSDTKLINFLIAAQAAQHQNAEVRRDAYLRQAITAEPAAKTAVGLTQAQLQIQHNQYEQALASLKELRQENPNHPYVLKLLGRLYERLQDWQHMVELVPMINKHKVYSGEDLINFERRSIEGLLKQQALKGQVEGLRDAWQKLPSSFRKAKHNILTYVALLIDFKQMDEADALLRPLVKKQCDFEVIALYGNIKTAAPTSQLQFLESWQRSQKDLPDSIYLTLGKLAYHAELWGKARHFLERSLQIKASPEGYLYMAKTLSQLNEHEHASDCYRLGLEHVTQTVPVSQQISLPTGSEDLIQNEVLPKFETVSANK